MIKFDSDLRGRELSDTISPYTPRYTKIKHVKRGEKELRERRFYFQESSKCRLEETPKEVPPTTPSAGREKRKEKKGELE